MDKIELELRTRQFAVRVIRFVGGFTSSAASRVIGNQLLKSGTSIGANYREANRAVSRRDFVHKITISEKEASETTYWLEICEETSLGNREICGDLLVEANELLAIFTSIGRSVRANDRRSKTTNDPQVSDSDRSTYHLDESIGNVANLLPDTMNAEDEQP